MNKNQIEALVIKHFPFDTFNQGQKEVIVDAVDALLKGTRHVVISAPTGCGKSAIAITIHKVMKAIRSSFKSCIITTTLGLQKQYADDYPNLLDLKSKVNYPCKFPIKATYQSQDCLKLQFAGKCNKDDCPYLLARDEWVLSEDIKTTNSAFYIRAGDSLLPTDDDSKLDLTIIDECHEIDKVIIDNMSLIYKLESYTTLASKMPHFKQYYSMLFDILINFPADRRFELSKVLNQDDIDFIKRFASDLAKAATSFNDAANKLQASEAIKAKIASQEAKELFEHVFALTHPTFLETQFEWIVALSETEFKLVPLSTRTHLTHKHMFSKAHQHIHMSATICGFEEYIDNLYINPTDSVYIEAPNPIPAANRPIFLKDNIHVNRDTLIGDLIAVVDKIIANQTGNGVIHTVSFKLANDIAKHSKYKKRMLVSNNRREILQALTTHKDKIILSPSIETGYDFKGDLARWQIIAKIPFLNLGDLYTIERKNISNAWYIRETILRFIQSSGRVCRGVNDYGETYVIDKNAFRLITQNKHVFPKWFMESIRLE